MKTQSHFLLGKKVFIRTLTNYYVGVLETVTDTELILSSASWVADTGRFYNALMFGTLNEVEPYPPTVQVGVTRTNMSDISEWIHPLPITQK